MTTVAGATTRLIALLGDPVAHSLSPRFQNAAIRAAGLDGVYLALRCDAERLPGLLRGIAAAGGAGNVTVPHKRLAATTVDERSEAVVRTGACNAFWYEDGRVHGDNTDVTGFRAAVRELLGGPALGARVLVLGAGGAARAVVVALALDGAARVEVANRTSARAVQLVEDLRAGAGATSLDALNGPPPREERYDLVVNATSLGLREDDPLPLPPEALSASAVALDLVCHLGGTRWVQLLEAHGVRATDGTEMLIRQGAAGFERWWGVPAPISAMRAALAPRT